MNLKNSTFLKSLMLLSLAVLPGIAAKAQYCTSNFHWNPYCTGDDIDGFSTTGGTANISNLSTGCNGNWDNYIYYSGQRHTATHGDVVDFEINNNPDFDEFYKIWVDWNQDGDFVDAGEQVYSSGSRIAAGGTATGSFTVPAGAVVGQTRLRVRSGFGFLGGSCDYADFGEVEDYDFFVMPSVANSSVPGSLVSPLNFCEGTYPVQVKVANTGNNVINNVQIAWTLDGVPQTAINYTTPIPVITPTPGSNEATITLGNVSFVAPNFRHTIEVTILSPNGVVNTAATGTNVRIYNLGAGLSGEYTVGGTTPHFPNVVDAANYLNNFGVCGPVTMKVRSGTYTGKVVLNDIFGSSTVNRITFKSETENANDVTIQYGTTSALNNNYVFQLNDASNITLKYLTIKSTATGGYGRVLEMNGDISNDSVFNNKLSISSTANWGAENISTWDGIYGGDNVFLNNSLTGGDYGMSMWGYQENVIIKNNTILDAYSQSMGLSDIYNLTLTDNVISTTSTASGFINTYHTGIAANYCGDNVEIARNRVKISNGGAGIESWSLYGSSFSPVKIYNNELIIDGSQQWSSAYGISMSGGYIDIYNNSVNVPSTLASNTAALNLNWADDVYVHNNVFANTGGGPAMFISDATSASIMMDYNNLHTVGAKLVNSNSGGFDSLSHWRISSGKDMNSISYDPGFTSANDLRPDPANPASWSVNGRAVHMPGNTVDKLGATRIENIEDGVPDIGAFEFTPTSTPPVAKAYPAQPASGITQVFTFGGDTVGVINWKATVPAPPSVAVRQYTGTVPPQFPVSNHMYFYTDVNCLHATYDLDAKIYYKDPWMGKISTESDLRVVKKEKPSNSWVAYNDVVNTTNAGLNILSGNTFTSLGYFTGIENDALFSAYIKPASTTVFCTGGAVTLNANTNPNAPYTYQWLFNGVNIPGANNPTYLVTNSGDYSVSITDAGNNTTRSMDVAVTIVATPSSAVTLSGPRRFCPGSSVTLNAQSGSNQTYQWMLNGTDIPGANGLTYTASQAGNYELKVKNIGCSNISTPISIVVGPVFAALGADTSYCAKSTLTLDAQNEGAKYLWNTGDTTQTINVSSTSGKYWVTVDAGPGCTVADTINVHVDPLPEIVGISSLRNGNTYIFEPGGMKNADNYLWIFGDGTTDTARTQTHVYDGTLYTLKLVVFNGCGSDTAVLELPLSVQDITANSTFDLYPNPATETLTLRVSGGAQFNDAVIVNSVGQIVYRQAGTNTKARTFDIRGLADGHYFIRANTSDNMVISKPFRIVR
ncbi:MAG: T9SS type A sorting domain-containing protein [Sphingobacteriales bacterium]|nr:MAG: T9SS type A sorting domain-containing protein [Sphingobacteriales bacterium]